MTDLRKTFPTIIKCGSIECRSGWNWLLHKLCSSLQWDIEKNGYPPIEAIQIKEKFGGLCFYTQSVPFGTSLDPETLRYQRGVQDGMIRLAESMSHYICENCGSMEGVSSTKSGWIQTLCKKCMDAYEDSHE